MIHGAGVMQQQLFSYPAIHTGTIVNQNTAVTPHRVFKTPIIKTIPNGFVPTMSFSKNADFYKEKYDHQTTVPISDTSIFEKVSWTSD